jgi:hypothetical protein
VSAINVRLRLATDTTEPSELRARAIDQVWYDALRQIPTEKLDDCYWAALAIGPKRNVFGPWDLLAVWRDNLRGRDGMPVRGAAS